MDDEVTSPQRNRDGLGLVYREAELRYRIDDVVERPLIARHLQERCEMPCCYDHTDAWQCNCRPRPV